MDELIKTIFSAPFQVLLFIAGIILLVLAIIGNYRDVIRIDRVGRFLAALVGAVLLVLSLSQNASNDGLATKESKTPTQSTSSRTASKSSPTQTFQNLERVYEKIEEGRKWLASDNFELAKPVFREAQTLDSEHPLPYFYLGLTYDRRGEIDEADRFYQIAEEKYSTLRERAERLRIRDYDALVEICHELNKDHKYESASNLSSIALDIPSLPDGKRYAAYACKGTSLFWLDQSEADRKASENAFNEALRIKESHLVYYNLGSLYASRFRNYSSAEKAYKASLKLSSEFIPAKRDLGFTYILSGNLENAESILEGIRENPSVKEVAEEGLRIVNVLEKSSQAPSTQLLSISSLNVFGNFTVHDFEQDLILKDPHDHDHSDDHDH